MYPRIMHFCLLLRFYEALKAKYEIHLGVLESVKFKLAENSIVGEISCWEDGFPMKYEVHSSLSRLSPDQLKTVEWLIYNGMASALPRILLSSGMGTIHFSHTLPVCVDQPSMLVVASHVQLHSESPGTLII